MKHFGDITKLNGADLPAVDCITGGSPCQDLSVAKGNREGLNGERSGLFLDYVRIVKEMRNATLRTDGIARPRYMVFENVPGALNSNGGRDFQKILTEIVRISEASAPAVPMPAANRGGWSKSGCLYDELGRWSIAYRIHNSEFWGSPQRRRRIALVADFGGLSAPEILFIRKGMRWDFGASQTKRKDVAGRTGAHIAYSSRNFGGWYPSDIAETVRASGGDYGGGSETLIVTNGRIRRKTPLETERLFGFPDDWTNIGDWIDSKGRKHKYADGPRYKALGNSIALPFWFYILRRISAQYERPATLGSLFDGIGGFPLCWERCNGKGTALWASEIAEFPIAVTKVRFPED